MLGTSELGASIRDSGDARKSPYLRTEVLRRLVSAVLALAVLLPAAEAFAQFHHHPRAGWHSGRVFRSRPHPGPRAYAHRVHARHGYRAVVSPWRRYYVAVGTTAPVWVGFPMVVYHTHTWEGDYDHAPSTVEIPEDGWDDSGDEMDEELDGESDGEDHVTGAEDGAYGVGDEYGTYDCTDGQCPSEWERRVRDQTAATKENAEKMFGRLENEAAKHGADSGAHRSGAGPAPDGGSGAGPALDGGSGAGAGPALEESLETVPEAPNDGNLGTMEPVPEPDSGAAPPAISDGNFNLAMEQAIVDLINEERTAEGLPPVAADSRLTQAARQHSQEMAELNYFSHESPEEQYRTLPMRLEHAGVGNYGWAGENIAMSSAASAAQFVKLWMDSPGHRANILRPEFKYTGVGVYGTGSQAYATQVFSSAR